MLSCCMHLWVIHVASAGGLSEVLQKGHHFLFCGHKVMTTTTTTSRVRFPAPLQHSHHDGTRHSMCCLPNKLYPRTSMLCAARADKPLRRFVTRLPCVAKVTSSVGPLIEPAAAPSRAVCVQILPDWCPGLSLFRMFHCRALRLG